MANYIASARSNYFKVKDKDAFLEAMERVPDVLVEYGNDDTVVLTVQNSDWGGWPSYYYNDEDDIEEEDFDIAELVSEHLKDDSVAIFMEVGAEKLRYVVGYAVAINSKGEREQVSLMDIYELAAGLTNKPENVTNCEF